MTRLLLGAAVLWVSAAQAQAVYRWEDAEGVTHYADTAEASPKGAKVFATDGEPITELGAVPVQVKKPAPPTQAAKQEQSDPAVPSDSEQFWREQFHGARERIHSLEDQIEIDKRKLEVGGLPIHRGYMPCYTGNYGYTQAGVINPQGYVSGPTGGYVRNGYPCVSTINPEYDRAKEHLEVSKQALVRAKEDLQELERQASFKAVPLEWRR